MSDPVQGEDAGTSTATADVEAAESVETDEAGADSATNDSADGDDGAAEASTQSDVPYSRFRNVNERRKAAEQEAADLRSQLAALQPKKEEETPKTSRDRLKKALKPAPTDLPVLEQFELYGLETLEAHLPDLMNTWFKEKFGMDVDEAGATLAHAKVSTKQSIKSQFEQAARARGLDPTNENVQYIVGSAMDTGRFKTFAEAMDAMVPAKAVAKTETRRVNGKGAETDSVDLAGLSRVRAMPLNKEDAMKLTSQNKRIENLSVVDILRATQAKP